MAKNLVPRAAIGFYDDSTSKGGTTTYLLQIVRALDRTRFDPVVFAPRPHPWHEDVRLAGASVITGAASAAPMTQLSAEVPGSGPRRRQLSPPQVLAWTVGLAKEVAGLVSLFRRHPVDLLHSNNAGAEAAPLAARIAGVPRILATWHVDPTYDLLGERAGLRYRVLEAASMRCLNGAIAVSACTKDNWRERCHLGSAWLSRVSVIHNGIDPSRLRRELGSAEAKRALGVEPDAPVIGSVGRLESAKGYEYLIRAVPAIAAHHPGLRVLLAGTGPLRADLMQLALSLGVSPLVRFVGFVDRVAPFLEALDVYVQPSLCEAHPIAVLEAAAMGLPIVATRVGGIPETITDGVDGFVTPTRDHGSLAEGISRLLRDSEMRNLFGLRAMRTVSTRFNFTRMLSETFAVYDRLLGCTAPSTPSSLPAPRQKRPALLQP